MNVSAASSNWSTDNARGMTALTAPCAWSRRSLLAVRQAQPLVHGHALGARFR